MLSALHGRINRRTFVIGNAIGLAVLVFFTALIVLPLAIIELALNSDRVDTILNPLYYLVAFPALLYYFFFVTLMVKRAHDVGWPGFFIATGFTVAVALGQVFELFPLNLLALLTILFFALKPGQKSRNNFGPVPRKAFKLEQLKVTFKDY